MALGLGTGEVCLPITLSDLSALNGIAGFSVATLYNNGQLTIADSQFNGSVVVSGVTIAKAIVSAGVDPAQNGIPLFEALAESQYDNLSTQTLVQLLLTYARQAGTGTTVPQDVGAAIANLVPGTLTAANAVSYVVQAADEVAIQSSQFGVSSTINANDDGPAARASRHSASCKGFWGPTRSRPGFRI